MNTNEPWKLLGDAARRRSRNPAPKAEMPSGFDTRVLARLREQRPLPAELWSRLAWRMVPVGAAVFMVCWLALRPAPESWITPDSAELADRLIQEVFPE